MIFRLHFICCIFIFSTICFGGFDYSAGFGARSLPLGAAVGVDGGFGKLLWGEKSDASSFRYGYIRPVGRFDTSGLFSRADVALEVFPISFFGISVGQILGRRPDRGRIDTLDCDRLHCRGWIRGTYVRGRLTLGHGPIFLVLTSDWNSLFVDHKSKSFGEESSALVGQRGHDVLWSRWAIFGFRLNATESIGLYWESDRMMLSGARNDLHSAFIRTRRELGGQTWVANLGAGFYDSTHFTTPGLTVFTSLRWIGVPSLAL